MAIVAGVDFGTLSVRVSIVDSEKGRLGSATAEYPLLRKKEDPDHATQRHADHMSALASATAQSGGSGGRARRGCTRDRPRYHRVERDSGGRGPGAARRLLPLVRPPRQERSGRDHREGARETVWRRSTGAAASTRRSGASRSCCTGCATTPTSAARWSPRSSTATWWRRCCAASRIRRRFRAVGLRHGPQVDVERGLGGLPADEFLAGVDPLLAGIGDQARRPLRNVGHRSPAI